MSFPCAEVSLNHVSPKPHQLKVANYMNRKTSAKRTALIVAHSVGSGKTITALFSAVCFLHRYPKKQVIILTPASVLSQFSGEVMRLVPDEYQSRIHCYSHTWWIQRFKHHLFLEQERERQEKTKKPVYGDIKPLIQEPKPKRKSTATAKKAKNLPDSKADVVAVADGGEDPQDNEDPEDDLHTEEQEIEAKAEEEAERLLKGVPFVPPDDCLLIVDEAHAFRSHTTWKMGWNNARLLNEAAQRTNQLLLLTATPIVNSERDVRNYIANLNRKSFEEEYRNATNRKLQKPEFMKEYVECGFSFFKSDNTEDYPEVRDHIVRIPMTEEYEKVYDLVQENRIEEEPSLVETFHTNPIPFLNGLRKAVNYTTMESPKIKWVLEKVKEDVAHGKKVLIYSALKDFGINRIKDGIQRLEIPSHTITGNVRRDLRQEMVSDFNKGKTRVLLITGAGAEGLDLKETRTLIILEPYWNNARLEQVKGRAVRFRSHAQLPPAERTVDIYTLVLTKRTSAVWGFKGLSARLGTLVNSLADVSSSETKMKHRLTLATADEILWKLSQMKTETILAVTQQIINGSIEKNPACWRYR